MKPNFALSLSDDKVELLHRTPDGWTTLGDVAFTHDDLPGALSELRKTALTHDPGGLRTKLILPDEQVKFLSLPDAQADDAAVRAALIEATPYSIEELCYEFTSDGLRTHVAAVARETLAEAEAFAVEHRFAPVSIVAKTVPGRFDGEPYFGMTKAAAGLLGPDDTVERDTPPSERADPEPEKEPKSEPLPEAKTPPIDVPELKDEAPKAELKQEEAQAELMFTARDRANRTPPDDVKNPGNSGAEPVTTPMAEPLAKSEVAQKPVVAPEPKATPATPKAETPPVAAEPRRVPQHVPPRPAPGTPPPAVAERLARIARTNISAERPDDLPPVAVPVPRGPAVGTGAAPMPAPKVPIPGKMQNGKAATAAPAVSGTPVVTTSPKAIAASLTPTPPPVAASSSGLFASRRKQPSVETSEAATAQDAQAPSAAAATPQDRGKMTVFDQRAEPRVGGKPRFLLLILVAILVLFLAVVAAFASIFSEDGLAGLFGRSPDTATEVVGTEVAAAEVLPEADAEIDLDPILNAAPSDSTPLTMPEAPAIETGPILALPAPPQVAPATAPEALATAAAPDSAILDPEVVAIPDAPPPPIVAEVAPPVVSPDTPLGTVLSPAEADRFYAATGVWLRAPRLVVLPTSQSLGDLSTALIDRAPTTQMTSLPAQGTLFPDAPLAPQLDPPAADVVFARDARGLILATADGTRTPYGMLIFAGQPSVVPPTRPGTVVPEIAPVAEVEVPTDEADGVSDALAALVAQSIPATEPQPVPLDGRGLVLATPDGTQAPGLLVFAGQPAVVPPTRPGTVTPQELAIQAALAEAQDSVPAAEAATAGAVTFAGLRPPARPETLEIPASAIPLPPFDGPSPVVRPDGLAPDGATVEDASLAVIDPATDTVATTLAAIVAAAPDPLAGATASAVARAITPPERPRNFARVVAAAQARQAAAPAAATTTTAAAAAAPEVVTSGAAQPTGPVPRSVAEAATIESAINLRQINLIGVFGSPGNRRALVRLANGQTVRVTIGDSLDGGRVTALGDNVINYVRRGQTIALGVPG